MPACLINGESRQIRDDETAQTLLQSLQLAGRKVALERNGEIVSKSARAQTRIVEGDKIEIVTAVGGG